MNAIDAFSFRGLDSRLLPSSKKRRGGVGCCRYLIITLTPGWCDSAGLLDQLRAVLRGASLLATNCGISLCHLLHFPLACEHARERCSTIAPVLPRIVGPIFVVGALSSGGVVRESLE
jgi:hypothetical protein